MGVHAFAQSLHLWFYLIPVILTASDFVWGNTCPLEEQSEVMARKSLFIIVTVVCPLTLLSALLSFSFTCSWLAFCLGLCVIQQRAHPQLCTTNRELVFHFLRPHSPWLPFHSAPPLLTAAVSRLQLVLQRIGWVCFLSVAKLFSSKSTRIKANMNQSAPRGEAAFPWWSKMS